MALYFCSSATLVFSMAFLLFATIPCNCSFTKKEKKCCSCCKREGFYLVLLITAADLFSKIGIYLVLFMITAADLFLKIKGTKSDMEDIILAGFIV